ncbi:APC family permease [Poseidonocella sp. HB161398]|uniref:APC family permease n=1 Tax=Poseidonocella sp. HB161398 TaxID=2320855 RepID=UPI0011093DD4|nr:APC family permease [Poseidonocella sp. HB161398]
MTDITTSTDSYAGAEGAAAPRLSGKMGPAALMLTVLAFSAPIAVVEGFIPFAIYFGGPGATLAFCLSTVVLLLFAIGYVTMARHVPKPGDFYAFVSSGLGKVTGLGAAFLAIFGYLCVLGGTYIFLGVSTASLIASFGGPETPWLLWAVLGWAAVSTLGYFHIELSAKILTWAMVFEVVIVMIFNVFTLGKGGAEGLSLEPFTIASFGQGDMAVTLLYTILVFMGFEATALFRDEVRDPDKTIPRATYGAVILIGGLYILSCYALVSAYGSAAWDVAREDPTSMFSHGIGTFVGPVFTQITYCSVVLSIFAALISIHNVLSRYILNLAVDKALPTVLAAVHDRHSSPHRASVAVAVTVGLLMVPAFLSGIDGGALYGIVVGIGAIGIIFLMGLVSISVIGWFTKTGIPARENKFKVYYAPGLAAVVLLSTTVFACLHLDLVVGGEPGASDWIVWLLVAVFLAGACLAAYFRSQKPHVFDGLGRAERVFESISKTMT